MAVEQTQYSRSLHYLLQGLTTLDAIDDLQITSVCLDSRKVRPGSLFMACGGNRTSGVNFIDNAIQAGAVAVVCERDAGKLPVTQFQVIAIDDLQHKAGIIAARFFGDPSRHMQVIGVTGTNGKTSVSWFLAQALSACQNSAAGLLGTLGYGRYGNLQDGPNTTPDCVTLQATLAQMQNEGAQSVVMEVSSHGLEQSRVAGVDFNIAVFTNLTSEHMDYHGDMDAYWLAKRRLFHMDGLQHGIINIDDVYGRRLAGELKNSLDLITYGVVNEETDNGEDEMPKVTAEVRLDNIDQLIMDISSPWGNGVLQTDLGGRFNAYNLLAALSTLCLLGVPLVETLKLLSSLRPVPGRLECQTNKAGLRVVIDYAHTPDALEKVLTALRGYCSGRLVCVFGCGGDRDRMKRPLMGRIAEQQSDMVILTDDNPRNENPALIIEEILNGFDKPGEVEVISDRENAIRFAIESAGTEDLILIAGKGHETYQDVGGKRFPFSDRQLVHNLLGAQV